MASSSSIIQRWFTREYGIQKHWVTLGILYQVGENFTESLRVPCCPTFPYIQGADLARRQRGGGVDTQGGGVVNGVGGGGGEITVELNRMKRENWIIYFTREIESFNFFHLGIGWKYLFQYLYYIYFNLLCG